MNGITANESLVLKTISNSDWKSLTTKQIQILTSLNQSSLLIALKNMAKKRYVLKERLNKIHGRPLRIRITKKGKNIAKLLK